MRTPPVHCAAAAAEFPWRGVSPAMAEDAHGVINNKIPETDEVTRLMDLPMRNRPPCRASSDDPRVQEDNGWEPSPGSPFEFFPEQVTLTPTANGEWVRVRMRALGLRGSRWRLSNVELWDEILGWVASNKDDISKGEQAARARAEGKRVVPHRPRTKTFIVTEDCFVEEARGKIWDLRPYWLATPEERADVRISLMQFEQDNSSFNVDKLSEACAHAKVPDELMAQAICKGGVWRPFTGTWSLVLEPNSKGFYEHIEFAQETTNSELASGVLQGTFDGPAFMPAKFHSRNVALQFRSGKIKPRGTGNLSLHGDHILHGTNSGWDLETDLYNFPFLDYVTSELFARDCGVARTACDDTDFEIRKNDWKSFYRQIHAHGATYWLTCAMSLSAGTTFDARLIFGDSSAPVAANRIENLLLYLVRFFCMQQWGITDLDDTSTWVNQLREAPWAATERVQQWIADRAAKFGAPTAKSFAALTPTEACDVIEQLWRLVPAAISGFFDDGFWAGSSRICADIQRAVERLSSECGIEAQAAKFERGTAQGFVYKLKDVEDSDTSHEPHHHVDYGVDASRWELDFAGHIQILGKEMDISTQLRQDSARRLKEACALTEEILRMAAAHPKRLVPVAAMERCRGQWNFITDTCKNLRALLYGLTASIKSKSRVWARGRGDKRKRAVKMGIAAGAAPSIGGGKWTWDEWDIGASIALQRSCDCDLSELMRAAVQYNGASWVPRRSAPDYDKCVWVFNDSAGLSSDNPLAPRAAACWAWSPRWDECRYTIETWSQHALETLNSTQEEAAGGQANMDWILQQCPWAECVIEVYDSQPTMHIFRRMACRANNLAEVIHARRRTAMRHPNTRILTLWDERAHGAHRTNSINTSKMSCFSAEAL